ncbi:MAG: L-seryl-tRNA(Sec) selenium transferase [Deltaproteobacteria bacterium]|nr:L-seryl-tRNA(Sec) selenium transferase [Deltaproteobacteria bacterium]
MGFGKGSADPEQDLRRSLPSVDRLLRELEAAEGCDLPRWALAEAVRWAIAEARGRVEAGELPGDVRANALRAARTLSGARPARVINATGVVLHTNLGRSVLGDGAAEAVRHAAAHYSDLELDLASGERGDRLAGLETKLRLLSGAGAAAVANNCAAAVLLALDTFARGKEVVVSRGELVEIGGSFRVPEILARAGVKLVEVGTTNRTHARDYEDAISPDTGLLLKVHRSNFEQRGFVAEVELGELAAIGKRRGVPVVEDLGSGTLFDLRERGFPAESFVPARLASGVDVVCFSGDKLLGGPQAGIALGAPERIRAMRKNPLARALRVDKLTLAALDWLATALLDGRHSEIPTLRMLLAPERELEARARELAAQLTAAGVKASVVRTESPVGGGSLPGFVLPSHAVALESRQSAAQLAAALRAAPPAVLARVQDARVLLDVRTLLAGDDAEVVRALTSLAR